MEKELISVIIPVYNVEPYLKDCLESVINQSYENLEIIIVNDGSTDNSGNICDEYEKKDSRIKVIHKENEGVSSARNIGLDICHGEYVSLIDSDDMIHHDFIQTLYSICKNNNCEIAMCDFIRFCDRKEIDFNSDMSNDIKVISSYEALQMLLGGKYYTSATFCWNKLYKKDIFQNIRYPLERNYQDLMVIHRVFDIANQIGITDDKLCYYRQRGDSATGKKYNPKKFAVINGFQDRLSYYKEKGYTDLYKGTLKQALHRVKGCYLNTKKYIDNNEMYLKNFKELYDKLYKEYRELNIKVGFIDKIVFCIFYKMPNLYYHWWGLLKGAK